MKTYISWALLLLFFSNFNYSQKTKTIEGTVLDKKTTEQIPYVTVLADAYSGTVTNESGFFSITLKETDSLKIQFLGYKTVQLAAADLQNTDNKIFLTEDITPMDEVFIETKALDAKDIIELVIENRIKNYNSLYIKEDVFVRDQTNTKMNAIEFDFKKSNIEGLDENALQDLQNKIPKNLTSYTDFLATVYSNNFSSMKLKPKKTVSLMSEDLTELESYEATFEKIFSNVGEKEYWKVKSGIFGSKIDVDQDTIEKNKENEERYHNSKSINGLKYSMTDHYDYVKLKDEDKWDFLYKTQRYRYEIIGTTSIENETVYIIEFTPKNKGDFEGKLFISQENYALIKADYKYAEGKRGKHFGLFGIGYAELDKRGTIRYEKIDSVYHVKYFTFSQTHNMRIDRKLAFQKKKDRFMFDKTLLELKINLLINLNLRESIEYISLKSEKIGPQIHSDFKQEKRTPLIHIDKYDPSLWEGYNILEPTTQLKAYRKQNFN